ncbi:MAG: hypothetical protein MUF49_18625 [Oculatellaceae cyanobacterium Prado106]|jgi:hypothetical protein|nr:hypothetical protein [Oculatellaceae cyanobacterium Prado106]
MSTWQSTVGLFAGLFSILCFIPYIVTTVQGKTQPSRVTWWIWFFLSLIVSATQYSSGAVHTIWLPLGGAIAQFVIAILSLKKGEGEWSRFDQICLLSAMSSLLLWWLFKSPVIAIILNLIADLLGTLPTIKKAYTQPETENSLTWVLYLIASILNLLAIENWSFTSSAFPVYIFLVNSIIVFCLLRKASAIQAFIPSRFINSHRSSQDPLQDWQRSTNTSQVNFSNALSLWCSRLWLMLQILQSGNYLASSRLGGKPIKPYLQRKKYKPHCPIQTQCVRPAYLHFR